LPARRHCREHVHSWSKEFPEAGKRRLVGDTARAATTDENKQLSLDLNEGEVAALVARGYLPEEARGDPAAIKAAIEA
jgi:hypothetical protein